MFALIIQVIIVNIERIENFVMKINYSTTIWRTERMCKLFKYKYKKLVNCYGAAVIGAPSINLLKYVIIYSTVEFTNSGDILYFTIAISMVIYSTTLIVKISMLS